MKNKKELKRTNIYLTKEQIKRIARLSEETGILSSEIIRRSIDQYLDEREKRL